MLFIHICHETSIIQVSSGYHHIVEAINSHSMTSLSFSLLKLINKQKIQLVILLGHQKLQMLVLKTFLCLKTYSANTGDSLQK